MRSTFGTDPLLFLLKLNIELLRCLVMLRMMCSYASSSRVKRVRNEDLCSRSTNGAQAENDRLP